MPRASSRSSARPAWSSAVAWARRSAISGSVGSASTRARVAEQEREPHEPRLGAVVQIALEAAALGVARLDEARPRGAELLQAGAQLGVEPRDVAAQQAGEERERQHGRGDECGPQRALPGARLGDGDQQEREQPAGVDRRELDALERRRPPPAAREPDEHDHEQHRVSEGDEREQRGRDAAVVVDEEHVLRAVVAAEVVRRGEEHRGQRPEREEQVARDGERAVRPRAEATRRERQLELQEDAAPETADDEARRVHERDVRQAHRGEEPREAEQHHEHAGPALGPAAPGVEAGADEPPSDRGTEDRPDHVRFLVVARQRQRDDGGSAHERREHDEAHAARRHRPILPSGAPARNPGPSRPGNDIQLTLRRGRAARPRVDLATAARWNTPRARPQIRIQPVHRGTTFHRS